MERPSTKDFKITVTCHITDKEIHQSIIWKDQEGARVIITPFPIVGLDDT